MSQKNNFEHHVQERKKLCLDSGLVSSNNQSMHLQANVE